MAPIKLLCFSLIFNLNSCSTLTNRTSWDEKYNYSRARLLRVVYAVNRYNERYDSYSETLKDLVPEFLTHEDITITPEEKKKYSLHMNYNNRFFYYQSLNNFYSYDEDAYSNEELFDHFYISCAFVDFGMNRFIYYFIPGKLIFSSYL